MTERVEVAIIGAGPAGLPAADVLGEAGCEVALLDEQPTPGGQIYRGIGAADDKRKHLLGDDYAAGETLLAGLDHTGIQHLAGATVWEVTPNRRLSFSVEGQARSLIAEDQVDALTFVAGGERHRLPCRSLLVHIGVTPNVQISRSLHLDHDWDPLQSCWRSRVDPLGGTSLPGIRIAGDGGGIMPPSLS